MIVRSSTRLGVALVAPVRRGDPAVSASGVGVRLGSSDVLEGVDLDVCAGEVVALVGPNGAGKSTLLSVLAGDVEPTRGTVEVAGRPVGSWTTLELSVRRGVLPQRSEVAFRFTVEQVVRMGREPWRGTDREDDDDTVVEWAVRATDVGHLLRREVPSLSGGEQARAAFARVLAQQACVLMLDEPTASLDIAHQEQVLRVARERAADGDAVVVVLHDLGLAAAYADRVAVMAAGRMVAVGPPATVFDSELLSSVTPSTAR